MPANAAKYETYPVPDNAQAIYVIDKDKQQTTSMNEIELVVCSLSLSMT